MRELATHEQQEAALGELEALLFAASFPLNVVEIARRLYLDEDQAQQLVAVLAARLEQPSRGMQLRNAGTGWRLETKPEHRDILVPERAARREKPLSPQSLEVLAVIALAQPVTTEEVSKTRGIESYAAIETLRRHGLVAAAGNRDPSSKATLWRTTQRFLDRHGLSSLAELARESSAGPLRTAERFRGTDRGEHGSTSGRANSLIHGLHST